MNKAKQQIVYLALLLPFIFSMAVNTYGLPECLDLVDTSIEIEMADEESSEDSVEDPLFVEAIYHIHIDNSIDTPSIEVHASSLLRSLEVIDPPPEKQLS